MQRFYDGTQRVVRITREGFLTEREAGMIIVDHIINQKIAAELERLAKEFENFAVRHRNSVRYLYSQRSLAEGQAQATERAASRLRERAAELRG